jgi:hypothetical protein
MNPNVDWDYQWSQIVARAWADAAFKARLLSNPTEVLKEYGLAAPAGLTLKVHENTDKVVNLVLPIKPAPAELSEEELHRAAGGAGAMAFGERCSREFCRHENCRHEFCRHENCRHEFCRREFCSS